MILLTGGTGSFGQRFVELVNEDIRVYSRGELLQHDMALKWPQVEYVIGDVRDRERLTKAAKGCSAIVHAAALKQIVICENNPEEAIQTNILGAMNIIHAAKANSVPKTIAISTDKAAYPINLYGATKMIMEKLFRKASTEECRFSLVRYGNVAGSRGSVIPSFLRQKETGVLALTDLRMTRFWITLDEAVRFVVDSLKEMKGGELFIPKLPSFRVFDLAFAIAPEAKKQVVGIREGEKLHEFLRTDEEFGGRYSSDQNDKWLTAKQLREYVATFQ
jgi:UDP-N-acetylglucosamine 4,6-dehydratase